MYKAFVFRKKGYDLSLDRRFRGACLVPVLFKLTQSFAAFMHGDKRNLKSFLRTCRTSAEQRYQKACAEATFYLGCCRSLYSQWFSVLSQVHASTEQEIREMHDEQANPQNAVVSLCYPLRKNWHCGGHSF